VGVIDMVINTLLEIHNLGVSYSEMKSNKRYSFNNKRNIEALRNVSFNVTDGENIAILGRNGAGKSTLLKCIAGFLRPSEGSIITTGRIMLLAGTNPGFQPNITGRENLNLLAPLYGIKKNDVKDFITGIEEFTLLGDALDRNYNGYSSGMKGKLGFGFMTGLTPDVLLIDETLGVGDLEFRAKAQVRLKKFIQRSGSVLMSTHSLGLASEMCTKGILLDKGEVIFQGDIKECIDKYKKNINLKG
jgi:ABC-type polysaccharide/polyol phosphate transport system ATPase subunit